MIKIITTLTTFLLGLLTQAQGTENRTASTFTKIEVAHNIELIYTDGAEPSIKIGLAHNAQNPSEITTETEDGILKINRKNSSNPEVYKVYVTGNNVNSIVASGAKVRVTNQLSAAQMNLTLSSNASFAGTIKSAKIILNADQHSIFNGRIETQNFEFTGSDNAKLCITGEANVATFHTNGRVICLAGNLAAKKLGINANEYSYVKVHAKDKIDIKLTEMARVTYTGKPAHVKMSDNAIALNAPSNGAALASN